MKFFKKLFNTQTKHLIPKMIGPSDYNKDPKDLRDKMERIYLDIDKVLSPNNGLRKTLDHKKLLNEDIDQYLYDMKMFTVRVGPDIDMPKERFMLLAYYLQADWYDLDGKHLYSSTRWQKDIDRALEYRTTLLQKVDKKTKELLCNYLGISSPDGMDLFIAIVFLSAVSTFALTFLFMLVKLLF